MGCVSPVRVKIYISGVLSLVGLITLVVRVRLERTRCNIRDSLAGGQFRLSRMVGVGFLVILVFLFIQVGLFSLVAWRYRPSPRRLVDLWFLISVSLLPILVLLVSLVILSLHVVIVKRSLRLSPIFLGLGIVGGRGEALTLTLAPLVKNTRTSGSNHSSLPSMRGHTCQSIHPFLSIRPGRFLHTNRSGQYSRYIQRRQAGQSNLPMDPSHSNQRGGNRRAPPHAT